MSIGDPGILGIWSSYLYPVANRCNFFLVLITVAYIVFLDDFIKSTIARRYIGLQEDDRRCEFCPGRVEDEVHFLFECTLLKTL